MEQGEKGSSFVAVVITVLVMIIIAGAGYYLLDQKHRTDKQGLDNQIASLTNQVNSLSAVTSGSSTVASTGAAAVAKSEWLYENTTYGFSLTFNSKWEGYKMKLADISGSTATYYVCVPTTDAKWTGSADAYAGTASVFAISVNTKAQWAEAEAEEGGNRSTKIGETAKYVFSYSQAQSGPVDVLNKNLSSDIKNVVATFEAL